MKKQMLVGVAVLCMCVLVLQVPMANAMGYEHKGGMDGKIFKKMHMILENEDELGLTADQTKSIKALKALTKKTMIKYNADIDILEVDIMEKMMADTLDVEAVNELVDQKYEVKKNKAKAFVDTCAQLRTILTEDQRTTMKGLMKEQKKAMKKEMVCAKCMKKMK